MVRRFFGGRNSQEFPDRQRVATPPGNPPLGPDSLEVSDQQHPKVHAGRNTVTAPLRVIRFGYSGENSRRKVQNVVTDSCARNLRGRKNRWTTTESAIETGILTISRDWRLTPSIRRSFLG